MLQIYKIRTRPLGYYWVSFHGRLVDYVTFATMTGVLKLMFQILFHAFGSLTHICLSEVLDDPDFHKLNPLRTDPHMYSCHRSGTENSKKVLDARARIHYDCDMEQEAQLMNILNGVELITVNALDTLQNPNPEAYAVQRYSIHFGRPSFTRLQVISRYAAIMRAVSLPQRVSIRCEAPSGGPCSQGSIPAYAMDLEPFIFLCPSFWALPYHSLGYIDDQISVILHQLTRIRGVMTPITTTEPAPQRNLDASDPWQNVHDRAVLVNNAFSYEWFAKDLLRWRHLQQSSDGKDVRGSWDRAGMEN